MLFKQKNPVFDTQLIIETAQKLIKDPKKEFFTFTFSPENIIHITAAYEIMNCNANKEFYSPIRMFQLGENVLVLEKIKSTLSPLQLEFESYTYIATYIFSIVNEAPPELFPLKNLKDILAYIFAHKKKMGKENFTYIITKCLTVLQLSYLSEYKNDNEIQIVMDTIETARLVLNNNQRYTYEQSIRKKCSKYKCVKEIIKN